jgi:hypothetical protein
LGKFSWNVYRMGDRTFGAGNFAFALFLREVAGPEDLSCPHGFGKWDILYVMEFMLSFNRKYALFNSFGYIMFFIHLQFIKIQKKSSIKNLNI